MKLTEAQTQSLPDVFSDLPEMPRAPVRRHISSAAVATKVNTALSSVFAGVAMTCLKLVVGLMTGSLGILSEAAHSLMDLLSSSITYFAVRIGDRPADDRHHYGHGKIESVSALIATGLLFLTSAWIIKEAIARLLADHVEVKVTWYGVAVIVISIIIDVTRSQALLRVARKTGSQALRADALHFASDILRVRPRTSYWIAELSHHQAN